MTSKQGYDPNFSKYFGKQMQIFIEDERIISGKVQHIDHFMNIVINDAYEENEIEKKIRKLGKIIIRGASIINWSIIN